MSPTVLLAPAYAPGTVAQAAALLRAGKLVVLPTETVYGIALNLHAPQARQRAVALKAIDGNPQWVIHIGETKDVHRYVTELPAKTRRLISRAWPGPVALRFVLSPAQRATAKAALGDAFHECVHEGAMTLRCPEHDVTREILSAVDAPVAILAAGTPGSAEMPSEVAELPEAIAAGVDAVVDGGPTRYRKPSTLVQVDGERLAVLRPGVIDERIIQRMSDLLILFVCSGNTCRSPMAAALAQGMLARRLGIPVGELGHRNIVVQSAGVHASRGMRATREAVNVMRERSLDLGTHNSQPATLDLLRRADVIYTMTDAHRDEVLDLLPGAAAKTHRLDPEGDVDDPIGSGEAAYRQVAERLEVVIKQRLDELVL